MRRSALAIQLVAISLGLAACGGSAAPAAVGTASVAPTPPASAAPISSSSSSAAAPVASAAAPVASASTSEASGPAPAGGSTQPGAEPLPSPQMVDKATGSVIMPSLDICAIVPVKTVRTLMGHPEAKWDGQTLNNACSWVYASGNGVTVSVWRYLSPDQAKAAFDATKPGITGHTLISVKSPSGFASLMDPQADDATVVHGIWVVTAANSDNVAGSLPLADTTAIALATRYGTGQ